MHYRTATEFDLSSIQSLARNVIDQCYRSFLGDESVNGFIDSGASDQEVAANLSDCTVVERNGEILGYCVHKADFIHILMISPQVQREGLGSVFLAHIETEMAVAGHDTLRLETFKGNTQALHFYQKNGWLISREETDTDFGLVRVFLEKRVSKTV